VKLNYLFMREETSVRDLTLNLKRVSHSWEVTG